MTLANTTKKDMSVIEGLATQARALRTSIELNLWQLARIFIEAKAIVPRGEWEKWLEENAGVSVRTAQDMMATYNRFGGKPQFESLTKSQMFRLLPLPEEAEEKFMQEHDVASMSAREIEKAVKAARQEEREKAKAEAEEQIRKAEDEAKETVNEAWRKSNAKLEEAEKIMEDLRYQLSESRGAAEDAEARAKAATEAAIEGAKDVSAQSAKLNAEAEKMRRELQDRDDMIADLQEQYNRVQADYLNLQSTVAKGDAERAPADQLTPEILAAAVRSFIGAVARMPHMRTAFAMMDDETKEEYSVLLETVETWARDSRRALETTGAEGTVI